MTNNVTFQRTEWKKALPKWALTRAVIEGEDAVKEGGDLYLPEINPQDESKENEVRNAQYLERAAFVNATGHTLAGLIGIAFGKTPDVDVPDVMLQVTTDTDGAGRGLVNQAHFVLEEVLATGRHGLLVDYPALNNAVTRQQQAQENIHATIATYPAEAIINWAIDENQRTLLVVLHEVIEELNGYEVEEVDQWRELAIGRLSTEDPEVPERYVVRIWRAITDGGEPELMEEYAPKNSAGQEWQEIPFTFVGANDNNPEIDKSPIYDLARLNIHHYNNSADFEESVFFNSQPTIVFTGLDEDWVDMLDKKGVYVGSRAAVPLPEGSNAMLLQAQPNNLASEGMDKKEKQMVALGARLLTAGAPAKTADQNRSDTAAAHSVLSLACDNVSEGYTVALGWVAEYEGAKPEDAVFSISTDFVNLFVDANSVNAIIKGWQSGAYPRTDMWAALRAVGLIDGERDDDTLAQELEDEGGDLPPNFDGTVPGDEPGAAGGEPGQAPAGGEDET